jgi:hypothetical protein
MPRLTVRYREPTIVFLMAVFNELWLAVEAHSIPWLHFYHFWMILLNATKIAVDSLVRLGNWERSRNLLATLTNGCRYATRHAAIAD